MISISSAMQQDKIKELLEGYDEEDIRYTFKQKQGIKMIFETTGEPEESVKKAKELIKTQSWGSVLYFQAVAVYE